MQIPLESSSLSKYQWKYVETFIADVLILYAKHHGTKIRRSYDCIWNYPGKVALKDESEDLESDAVARSFHLRNGLHVWRMQSSMPVTTQCLTSSSEGNLHVLNQNLHSSQVLVSLWHRLYQRHKNTGPGNHSHKCTQSWKHICILAVSLNRHKTAIDFMCTCPWLDLGQILLGPFTWHIPTCVGGIRKFLPVGGAE